MGGRESDLEYSIDDAMDDGELLPFRYLNVAELSASRATLNPRS